MTRELETWGIVDGEVVNGVIDLLSFECPDPELEQSMDHYYTEARAMRDAMPESQTNITDFLLSAKAGVAGSSLEDALKPSSPTKRPRGRPPGSGKKKQKQAQAVSSANGVSKIYITDVKTRSAPSIPKLGSASFRPTQLQLQMYFHMLTSLVVSEDADMLGILAERHSLDVDQVFSDDFIAEMGGLNEAFYDALEVPTPEMEEEFDFPQSSQDSLAVLTENNTLKTLWSLMMANLRVTFLSPKIRTRWLASPNKASFRNQTIISPLLTARYLSSQPPVPDADPNSDNDSDTSSSSIDPLHLGSTSFLHDPDFLNQYLNSEMKFWRGKNRPVGVEIGEAWKCRMCEFRDLCTWREEKEEEMRVRREGMKRSIV